MSFASTKWYSIKNRDFMSKKKFTKCSHKCPRGFYLSIHVWRRHFYNNMCKWQTIVESRHLQRAKILWSCKLRRKKSSCWPLYEKFSVSVKVLVNLCGMSIYHFCQCTISIQRQIVLAFNFKSSGSMKFLSFIHNYYSAHTASRQFFCKNVFASLVKTYESFEWYSNTVWIWKTLNKYILDE